MQQHSSERCICLEYLSPWLGNLSRLLKQNDQVKKDKVGQVLDNLITITIEEADVRLSVARP